MTGHLSDEERERRTRAVHAVIHSGRLEGFADNHEWQAMLNRFADGHITREELRTYAHDSDRSSCPPATRTDTSTTRPRIGQP